MNDPVQTISQELMDSLSDQACESARRRTHFNFHESYADPYQRLIIALEPETYIQPHRHLNPPKPETFIVLRGKIALFLFSDTGQIAQSIILATEQQKNLGVDIPPGIWHTALSLQNGSIFFEAKPGPFDPAACKNAAPWAPNENDPSQKEYLNMLYARINQA